MVHGLAVVFDGLAAHQVVHWSRTVQIGRRRVGSGRHCPIAYQTHNSTSRNGSAPLTSGQVVRRSQMRSLWAFSIHASSVVSCRVVCVVVRKWSATRKRRERHTVQCSPPVGISFGHTGSRGDKRPHDLHIGRIAARHMQRCLALVCDTTIMVNYSSEKANTSSRCSVRWCLSR